MFNWQKTLILIQGLPSSGKSTIARTLVPSMAQIVENDDYFMVPTPEGKKYLYVGEMIPLAVQWCESEAFRRLMVFDTIVVANTFIKRAHVLSYVDTAIDFKVNVKILMPNTSWAFDVQECFKRNTHGCPLDVIQRMHDGFEVVSQADIDQYVTDNEYRLTKYRVYKGSTLLCGYSNTSVTGIRFV